MSSENVSIDRLSRALFYAGAMIILAFIAWAQIAPTVGTDPIWWDPDMGKAAALGIVMMSLAFLGVLLGGVWGSKSDE